MISPLLPGRRRIHRCSLEGVRPDLAGFLGRRASLIDSRGLRSLIRSHIRFDQIEDTPIPLHVVVTDVLDGGDSALSSGSAIDVITASVAIPGVFAPVDVRPNDFSRAAELIERSYASTVSWLDHAVADRTVKPLADHAHRAQVLESEISSDGTL